MALDAGQANFQGYSTYMRALGIDVCPVASTYGFVGTPKYSSLLAIFPIDRPAPLEGSTCCTFDGIRNCGFCKGCQGTGYNWATFREVTVFIEDVVRELITNFLASGFYGFL